MKRLFLALAILTSLFFVGCSPKDADIKAELETKLNAEPGMTNVTADVKDGVATISGECKDQACKDNCEKVAKDVKGVKSVVSNLMIAAAPAPAPTAPLTVTPDDSLTSAVTDATKDYPGVKAEVKDGVVTLTGEIKKAKLQKLIEALSSLKPKKIENQLTIK